MIEIIYNNRSYFCSKSDSLKTLLTNLIELPLSKWKELLIQKDGVCLPSELYDILVSKIQYYDKSDKVNSFIYNGEQYWFSAEERVKINNLINASTDTFNLVLGDQIVNMSVDKVKEFFKELEVYAGECYVNTKRHLLAIKELKTEDDLINYDFTTGYPDKVIL